MNTSLRVLGFVLICAFPCIAMAESGFEVGGAVGIQSKQLEYQFVGATIKPAFQTVVYSLTTSYGKFFVNAELETMIESTPQYSGDPASRTTTTIDSQRSDSAITLGYSLWRGLSIFGGYKLGETESNISPTDGGVLKLVFSQRGPFAGLAYAQPIGTKGKGSLVASVAYAGFKGEADVRFLGTASEFTTDGTSSGLSYGIGWNGALSERAYYRLSFKINKYKFKDEDFGFEGKDLSTKEDYKIIGLLLGTSF